MTEYRMEKDALGEVRIPAHAYWGAETQRAVDNFPISGRTLPREFIHAVAVIKRAGAVAARELKLLAGVKVGDGRRPLWDAIVAASDEVIAGHLDAQFPIDVFQTGSGTSTNMNLNEVIANRAAELCGLERGRKHVHPNDHVNICQSSNDVIPAAMNLAALLLLRDALEPALRALGVALADQSAAFAGLAKIGRTHLQDATPVTLGQEFGGYARQMELALERLRAVTPRLSELALGGTAVGTGINAAERFTPLMMEEINRQTGLECREAKNHFEAQSARDVIVELSGQLRVVAVSLRKIAEDLRWMASGPESGLDEVALPALQPGSSIMPGKVNPVIPEAVLQVAAQVTGNDAAVAAAAGLANFELATGMPVMAANIIDSLALLAGAARVLTGCVSGLKPNRERLQRLADMSSALATVLVPVLGHDQAVRVARLAKAERVTVKEIVLREKLLPPAEADRLLDPLRLTKPFRA